MLFHFSYPSLFALTGDLALFLNYKLWINDIWCKDASDLLLNLVLSSFAFLLK